MRIQITFIDLFLIIIFLISFNSSENYKHDKVDHDLNFEDELLVDTVYGKVLGKREGEVNVFLGIPFAEPPLGRLRFRPPRPKRPWYPSIYHAIEFAPECLQSNLFAQHDEDSRPKDEDCLYLNIWQPRKRLKQSLLPVLIWVYGGAFIHGGTNKPEYYGNQLAEKGGVIVVSFNYRLGALGFLVSISDGLYGNYGLDDQRTAFQWVQDNILSFGGDPDRITLFGESAGAMSIGIHLLDQQNTFQQYQEYRKQMATRSFVSGNVRQQPSSSLPAPKKLFHAVIMQSNPFGYKYRSVSIANFIGSSYKELLDCDDLKCLQSEPAEELIHVQDTLMAVPRSIGDFFTWGPVITDESYWREVRLRPSPISNVTVFQPMDAIKLLSSGVNVPIIMGSTKHEGTVFVFTAFKTRMTKVLYQFLLFSFFRSSSLKIMKMYRKLTKSLEDSPYPDYRLVLSQIIGDYLFRCPNQYFASQLTGMGTSVFLYEFSLPTRTPGFPCCDGLSCHTCELPYVFHQMDIIASDYTWTTTNTEGEDQNNKRVKDKDYERYQKKRNQNYVEKDVEVNFPDIFGAGTSSSSSSSTSNQASQSSTSSFPFTSSSSSFLTPHNLSVDAEVSRLMLEYWTTFATYGDPNGLLSMDANGYLSGTRPNAPWWPKLLGDLPSLQAVREIQESVFAKFEPTSTDNRRGRRSFEEDFDEKEEDIRNAGGNTRFQLHSSRMKGGGTDTSMTAVQRNRLIDAYQGSFNHQLENDENDYDQLSPHAYYSLEQAANGFSSTKSMHQLVFNKINEIVLIENDCVCNAWNLLEYRF